MKKNSFFFFKFLQKRWKKKKSSQSYDICVSNLVVKTKVDTINSLGTKLKNGAKYKEKKMVFAIWTSPLNIDSLFYTPTRLVGYTFFFIKNKKGYIMILSIFSFQISIFIENYQVFSEYHKYVFLLLTWMVGLTMNLISETHHSCKRRKHVFMVLSVYTIIFLFLLLVFNFIKKLLYRNTHTHVDTWETDTIHSSLEGGKKKQ